MSYRKEFFMKIDSGLGNQFFQYAAGCARAERLGLELVLDPMGFRGNKERFYGLKHFRITARTASFHEVWCVRWELLVEQKLKIPPRSVFRESKFYHFDPRFFEYHKQPYFSGYWQALGYVLPVLERMRRELVLRQPVPPELAGVRDSLTGRVCAVHIRRGDYVNHEFFYPLPAQYYQRACELVAAQRGVENFLVFSDDPDWARENLRLAGNVHFSMVPRQRPEWDFALMRSCDDFVISNSTFSWWAAMLGSAPDKLVVRPERWFKIPEWDASELLPQDWTSLDSTNSL